jgi:hypothetical protein
MSGRHPFTAEQHSKLLALRTLLETGSLRWSEFAIRTPFGDRLRQGWDPRFESPQPTAHRTEP